MKNTLQSNCACKHRAAKNISMKFLPKNIITYKTNINRSYLGPIRYVILEFGAIKRERLKLKTSSLLLTRISRIEYYVPKIRTEAHPIQVLKNTSIYNFSNEKIIYKLDTSFVYTVDSVNNTEIRSYPSILSSSSYPWSHGGHRESIYYGSKLLVHKLIFYLLI